MANGKLPPAQPGQLFTPGAVTLAPTPSNTTGGAKSGTAGKVAPSAATGTGIGVLAIAGLGAVALANTKVGPVVIAALVAAVIWNGNALVGVIGGMASTVNLGVPGGGAGAPKAGVSTLPASGLLSGQPIFQHY